VAQYNKHKSLFLFSIFFYRNITLLSALGGPGWEWKTSQEAEVQQAIKRYFS
jgi:hypothetical protein